MPKESWRTFFPCQKQNHSQCSHQREQAPYLWICDCPCHSSEVRRVVQEETDRGREVALRISAVTHHHPGGTKEGHIVEILQVNEKVDGVTYLTKLRQLHFGLPAETVRHYRQRAELQRLLKAKSITETKQ